LVTEAAVGSALIVEADPSREHSSSVTARLIDRRVGPLVLQGLNEPFGFAVRAGPVRSSAYVLDAQSSTSASEVVSGVTAPVVAEEFAHANAVQGEPSDCSFEESDRGAGSLVREYLDVRDAAVVVDRDVHVFPPLSDLRPHPGSIAPHHSMARPHEPGELLDVNVDEFTRPASHVTVRWFRRFQPRQSIQAEPVEHRANR